MTLPSATLLAQSALSGLFVGALYGLLGLGLSLSWGLLKQINLAHFALAFLAAYLCYQLSAVGGMDPLVERHQLVVVTAACGEIFVGMQAFEWSKLILEGVRPWGNPWGAAQFGSTFFMITGFHGLHVTGGVILLLIVAIRLLRGSYEKSGNYQIVEIVGLYWHFVDLVWVFIFALFYLW